MKKQHVNQAKKYPFPLLRGIVSAFQQIRTNAQIINLRKNQIQKTTPSFTKKIKRREKVTKKRIGVTSILVVIFFLLSALFFIATIKGQPGNPNAEQIRAQDQATEPFELSPERGRYAHTVALAENGSLSLSQPLAEAVYPDVGYIDGRFYSFFAPGISILAVPFYKLGSIFNLAQVATFSVISLFALGTMFFLYKIGKDIFSLNTPTALLAPIIFAFGSTAWSYATTLYQHHLTTFFIISSFYAVWKYSKKTKWSYVWGAYIWSAYALAFTVDYPNLVLMLPIILYFFFSSIMMVRASNKIQLSLRPAIAFTSIVFVLISLLHAYYNQTQFGSWKTLSGSIVGYRDIKERNLTLNDTEQIKVIADRKTSHSFFSEEKLPGGVYTLLIAPDKGIFFFSPLFLLGGAAVVTAIRKLDTQKSVLLSIIGVNLFLYASFGDPWGGWAFGPRYLILSMSVLSLFIAVWLAQVKHQVFAKGLLLLLFAYSSAISLIGVLTTNAVPPKVEADYLHSKYGYFLNLDFFKDSHSSSFIYNQYFAQTMSLQQYFLVLYGALLTIFIVILVSTRYQKGTVYEA